MFTPYPSNARISAAQLAIPRVSGETCVEYALRQIEASAGRRSLFVNRGSTTVLCHMLASVARDFDFAVEVTYFGPENRSNHIAILPADDARKFSGETVALVTGRRVYPSSAFIEGGGAQSLHRESFYCSDGVSPSIFTSFILAMFIYLMYQAFLNARQVELLLPSFSCLPGSFGYERAPTVLSVEHDRLADVVLAILCRHPAWGSAIAASYYRLHLSNVHEQCPSLGSSQDCSSSYSAFLQRTLGKRMHALNGNISSAVAKQAYPSTSIEALGGVRQVLTELPASSESSSLNSFWTPLRFPRQLTNLSSPIVQDLTESKLSRANSYVRHFPKLMSAPRLPEVFTDVAEYLTSFRYRVGNGYNHIIPASFTRDFDVTSPSSQTLQTRFEALGPVLDGALDSDSLSAANKVMALNRFLDTRGNRQVVRWEAESWDRWIMLANFAASVDKTASWVQPLYRLWARYVHRMVYDEVELSHGRTKGWTVHGGPACHGNTCNIVHINAVLPAGANPVNPEAPMWTADAQSDLRTGRAQFVDAEGMTTGEIIELLSALVPIVDTQVTRYNVTDPRRTTTTVITPAVPAVAATSTGAAVPAVAAVTQVNVQNEAVTYGFLTGANRYTYPNGTRTIFVHHGNKALPDAITQALIENGLNRIPNTQDIASVIRHVCTKYDVSSHSDTALESVIARSVVYDSYDVLGKRPNLGNFLYINADGSNELHLPRAYTAHAYFDVFKSPCPVSAGVNCALALKPLELLHNAALVAQARATSLNWAAFSVSMLGQQWGAGVGTSNNQFIRNHTDVWLRRYNTELLNLWTTVHANAMAHQYNFTISPQARELEAQAVVNWWGDFQAPYLGNHYNELWMMEQIPSHQILPFYVEGGNSPAPTWPSDTPKPVSDFLTFQGDVQLARDLPPFTGRTYMADGGTTRNAQFYMAQGNGTGFRFEGSASGTQLARWSSQYYHQFPQAPANDVPTWMAAVNSEFADFLLPGSIPALNMATNRVYSWGVHQTTRSGAGPDAISRRWYEASLGMGEQSLMVNYISPTRARRQIDSLQEYTLLIWEDGNRFAGITTERSDLPDIAGSAYLDKMRVPVMPRDHLPVAISDPGSYQPDARVTRKAKSTPQSKSAAGDETVLGRITAYRRTLEAPADIQYAPKVPLFQEDVPALDTFEVTTAPAGISVDTYTPLGGTNPDRLSMIEERIQEVGRLQDAYLAEMSASLKAARDLQRHSQGQNAQPRVQRRPTSPVARNTPRMPPVTTAAQPTRTYVSGKNLPVKKVVEPNDSAGATAQAYADSLRVPQAQRSGYGAVLGGEATKTLPRIARTPAEVGAVARMYQKTKTDDRSYLQTAPQAYANERYSQPEVREPAESQVERQPNKPTLEGFPGYEYDFGHATVADGQAIANMLEHDNLPGPATLTARSAEN